MSGTTTNPSRRCRRCGTEISSGGVEARPGDAGVCGVCGYMWIVCENLSERTASFMERTKMRRQMESDSVIRLGPAFD